MNFFTLTPTLTSFRNFDNQKYILIFLTNCRQAYHKNQVKSIVVKTLKTWKTQIILPALLNQQRIKDFENQNPSLIVKML